MKLPQFEPFKTTRRELLQMMGVGAAWALVPASGCAPKKATPYQYKFLSTQEVAALGALANAVLIPDSDPGGQALGVTEYVDRLLSAFEGGGPIFAGGPYSGRAPLQASDGTPSKKYPSDDFNETVTLDRVAENEFRLMLYGSSGVTGGAPNDSTSGPIIGLRDQVRNAIKTASGLTTTPLENMDAVHLAAIFSKLDGETQTLLINLVCEGAFSPPEYGGNASLGGWKIANFEGDRQPVGFSWYDATTNSYSEDPQHPVSEQTPGTDPAPLDSTTSAILDTLVNLPEAFTLGMKFS